MWYIYIRSEKSMDLISSGEMTRKQQIAARCDAASKAKARNLSGANVMAYGPCGQIKIGIHGYK